MPDLQHILEYWVCESTVQAYTKAEEAHTQARQPRFSQTDKFIIF